MARVAAPPSASTLAVIEDVPGQLFRLQLVKGLLPGRLARFLVPLLFGAGAFVYYSYEGGRLDWLGEQLLAHGPLGGLAIGIVLLGIGLTTRDVRSIAVDSREGLTLVTARLGGLLRWRTQEANVERIALHSATPERVAHGGGPAIEMAFAVRGRSTPIQARVMVAGVDRRQEILDLAARMGAAASLAGLTVDVNDPTGIGVSLTRHATDGETAIPRLDAPADYRRDVVAAALPAPEEKAARFDPARLPSEFRVLSYRPGEEIVLRKPLGLGALLFVAIPFGLPAAGVTYAVIRSVVLGTANEGHLFAAGFAAFLFAVVGLVGYLARPRRTVVSFGDRSIVASPLLGGSRSISFDDVGGVDLVEVHQHSRSDEGRSRHSYWYEVRVQGGGLGKGLVLLNTRSTSSSSLLAPAYAGIYPLAREIAEGVGVELRETRD